MIRVVLLEDEPPALAQLQHAVRAARADVGVDVDVVASFDTVAGARAWFTDDPMRKRASVDLVISDIQLADGLSLSLFAEGVVTAPVVFATAYDQYVMDAFRCMSVDYLLKPIAHEDVARALQKLERMRGALTLPEPTARALGDVVREPRRRLLVRKGAEVRAVNVDDVAYFVAEDKLTLLITKAGVEHVIDKTLNELERELDVRRFFRANRGVLVGVDAVKAFRSAGKGRIMLTLEPRPKDDVVVSQENAAAFRAFIDR